ncbi:thiamine-triphosphatase isoform X1 [Crotalus tigris]|uniref:thiamine-triphosphatase isoform X1 n=1 Tax=Crotalus tigris TaxID=88082 RepID=UPI00192F8B65|nr:thiamine-triphosphatase isoform X1 [Crotalus tigris]
MERGSARQAPAAPDPQPGEGSPKQQNPLSKSQRAESNLLREKIAAILHNFGPFLFFVCAPDQASGAIEVEQKFLFGPNTIEKLAELGAILESRVSFRDSYYDVPDWCLTRADHWLRDREGVGWELKCPPVRVVGSKGTLCAAETDNRASSLFLQPPRDTRPSHAASQYQEMTCPQNIVTRLCGLLDRDPGPNWSSCVNKAVEELGLQVFASFVTTRQKYRAGDLHVDLDTADFGYAVGEVEAVVQQLEDVPEALEKIQEFSRQLGLREETAIPGKMSVYLYRFRPAHYQTLTEAGIVRKVINTTEGQDGKV